MVDIENRPDLATLLAEAIGEYDGTIKDDRIILPIKQFQERMWYGISLYCKPKRSDIDAYICVDCNFKEEIYLTTFWNGEALEEILEKSIEEAKKCCYCHKTTDLKQVKIIGKKHYCEKCSSKVSK